MPLAASGPPIRPGRGGDRGARGQCRFGRAHPDGPDLLVDALCGRGVGRHPQVREQGVERLGLHRGLCHRGRGRQQQR